MGRGANYQEGRCFWPFVDAGTFHLLLSSFSQADEELLAASLPAIVKSINRAG